MVIQRSLKVVCSVMACFSASLLIIVSANILFFGLLGSELSTPPPASDATTFLKVVVVAPIVETLIFQSFLIGHLRKKVPGKDVILVFISSIIFGLWHYYDVFYVLMAGTAGLVLSFSYLFCLKQRLPAFFVVSLSHALTNFALFLLNYHNIGF